MKNVALVGMPNCGKSSLFNRLTRKHAYTGNRAGVTVRGESAVFHLDGGDVTLIDLPGIRSMHPTSPDECETLRMLSEEPPDLVLFVCDATDFASQVSLLQGLSAFLDRRPRERGRARLAVAFNFCDELTSFPDATELSSALGLPSVAVSARTGWGMEGLRLLLTHALFDATDCSRCGACRASIGNFHDVHTVLGEVSPRAARRSAGLDALFLHPFVGYLLFFAAMGGMLHAVFGRAGEWVTTLFRAVAIDPLASCARGMLSSAPAWLRALICDGIVGGVGAVLDFLPRLMLLFLFRTFLEESGAMARFNRLFDKPLSHIGLRGDAMTALLLGFGCTVPAILCTRAMKDRTAARRCACALAAVACSARLPLCLWLTQAFFGIHAWWICGLLWIMSALCFLLICAVLSIFSKRKHDPDRHADALPRWRFPSLFAVLRAGWEEALHFLQRAGGIILLTSVLVWGLASFDTSLRFVGTAGMENSLLAHMGRAVSPLFAPLGLHDWRIISALLAGIGAKEASLSTLGVLLGGGADTLSLTPMLSEIFTPASALSFLVFYCLYFPCTATVAAMRSERLPLRVLIIFPIFAYLLAGVVYFAATYL